MTRYTSCTHIDRSPLLYVHVGLPVQPTNQSSLVTLIFDLLTLKVVSMSRVTWATSVPILVFLGLSVLDLCPMNATDSQASDRRRTKASLNAPPIRGGGITNGCCRFLEFLPDAATIQLGDYDATISSMLIDSTSPHHSLLCTFLYVCVCVCFLSPSWVQSGRLYFWPV